MNKNGEKIEDYDRFKTALSQVVGKRLSYKELIGSYKKFIGKEGESTDAP